MHGGSGGYIYINTREESGRNRLDRKASIEAMGGYGKNQGLGGAGGVLFFDGSVRLGYRNAKVNGGLGGAAYIDAEPKGCSAGAAGTAHWVD